MALNLLELFYESRLPVVRQNIVESILLAEKWENFTEIESLVKVLNQQEKDYLIQEGFWDRMKARGSQAVGAAKGLGNQLKGVGQQAVGNAAGKLSSAIDTGLNTVGRTATGPNKLQQYAQQQTAQGQANVQQGQQQGQQAKIQSYITNSANTIANDFQKLGIQVPDIEALKQQIKQVFDNNISGRNPPPIPQATPPPIPQGPTKQKRRSPSAAYGL